MNFTCVNLSSFRRLVSFSISGDERGLYFSRSPGDTELFRYKIEKMITDSEIFIILYSLLPVSLQPMDRQVVL